MDINGKNNISPVNSNIESNTSSNDAEQLKKLNDRLDQFINNNFNYTNKEPSPIKSNNSNNYEDLDYFDSVVNKCNNSQSNDDAEYVNIRNETDLKNNLTNKQDLQDIIKLLGKKKPSNDSNYVKSFFNTKINDMLNKSNMSDKLLLYSLINKGTIVRDSDSNSDDGVNNFNKVFDQDNIEKYFQKEVIRFTIENFCKYLKQNGYSIIKQDEQKNDSDEKNIKKMELKCPHTDKKHYAKVNILYVEYVQCLLS